MTDDSALQAITDRLLTAGMTEAAQALRLALYEVETCVARAERLLARYEEARGLPPSQPAVVDTYQVLDLTGTTTATIHLTRTPDGRVLHSWESHT